MLEKEIRFIAPQEYIDNCDELPVPIKLNIPKWFKKLEHSTTKMTIKGCIPFLDSLTTGYLLKLPIDFKITHNVTVQNKEGKPEQSSFLNCPVHNNLNLFGINLNYTEENQPPPNVHGVQQLEGSPLIEKNKNLPVYKILNPWKIITPPGYSCLFVPPLNNADERFQIISGIVDTDTFPDEVNFPCIINGYKYPILNATLKKGTPYVQVIPFKRENWKMKIESRTSRESKISKLLYPLNFIHSYKSRYWKKKSFK